MVSESISTGEVKPLSKTKFTFVPAENLMDGVRYVAEVLGQEEAESLGEDEWVKNLRGDPLVNGRDWYFWTMPDIQVNLVPVQVLENKPLIVNKPTVLRTFIRWDYKPNVQVRNQVRTVIVDDVTLVWTASGGEIGTASWRGGVDWELERNKKTAERKREYLEYTNADRELYQAGETLFPG